MAKPTAAALFISLVANAAIAAEPMATWPPTDPQEYDTKVDFTEKWAKRLMGFKTLADLQKSAGTKGTISEVPKTTTGPYGFHWRSKTQGRVGYMLATVYPDGGIGVGIETDDGLSITVNNFGAFMCDRCSPPVEIQGLTPSWAGN